MRQLVSSWVQAMESGYYRTTLPEALARLNAECGCNATLPRVTEWRSGRYTPTPKVLSAMLYEVLPWALREAGIPVTRAQLAALDALLWSEEPFMAATDGSHIEEDGDRHAEVLRTDA